MLWWNHIRSHEVSLKRQITICKFKTLNHMELYQIILDHNLQIKLKLSELSISSEKVQLDKTEGAYLQICALVFMNTLVSFCDENFGSCNCFSFCTRAHTLYCVSMLLLSLLSQHLSFQMNCIKNSKCTLHKDTILRDTFSKTIGQHKKFPSRRQHGQ